jgi:hypothetical protein
MSSNLSGLIAAWLIAAACIGLIVPLRQTLPTIEITARTHPPRPSLTAPAPKPSAREMPFGRTDLEEHSIPIAP